MDTAMKVEHEAIEEALKEPEKKAPQKITITDKQKKLYLKAGVVAVWGIIILYEVCMIAKWLGWKI